MTSELPFGAPMFDKIKKEHYLPAIEQAIASAKEDVDAIVADPREPDFENTIVALEQSGATLDSICNILFNLLEADSDEQMQEIAEKVSPLLTEYQLLSWRLRTVCLWCPAVSCNNNLLTDSVRR